MVEIRFLTIEQTAEGLGITERQVLSLINAKLLTCYRINARVFRIRPSDLADFLERCRTQKTDAPMASEK